MNALATAQGERIKELRDELAAFDSSIRSKVGVGKAIDLQRQRDTRTYRLSVLERRLNEAVDDRARIKTELGGYRKALSLFEDSPSGPGLGRSGGRLVIRINQRIEEERRLANEVLEVEGEIGRFESELRSVEERLINEIQDRIAEAASRQAANADIDRMRARGNGETLPDQPDAMWSPSPVLAYRVWTLRSDGFYGSWNRWASSTSAADCTLGSGLPHTDGRCNRVAFGCGIYAAKDMGQLLRGSGLNLDQNFAAGLVALEGKVVEHERGYRAERVRVLSLVIVYDGVMTIVDDEADVHEAFVDPWKGGTETVVLPAAPGNDAMRRTIKEELKKREEGQNLWT